LEGVTGCAIASSVGKRVKPLDISALLGDQFGDSVALGYGDRWVAGSG
jgi:hypothetical protein